ncbi:hypothetical protein EDB86DRAFT_272551 [Lactarius hatsudake]|nr:hypothetical protein EDB86DRAFT_331431 [Lactarius hatsudake]KAH8983078.1 hypothetical protein EDB86DRAFT_272551 [Lactarius hatsudake]
MNQAIVPADVLVYGFVAQTFKPEDANRYFTLLLRPRSQHFLQYYGIRYHQGAWYITLNANLVQGTSPGVPFHATPLLDYSNRTTQGTVVPQQRWIPGDAGGSLRRVERADLQLPIYFVNSNGSIGFPLLDILRGCDGNLHNANGFASLGGRTTTRIGINWPGYRYWNRQILIRDDRVQNPSPITLGRFMKYVGTSVDKFLRECMTHDQTATDPRWQIGGHGGITQAEVKLIGAIHVSAGCWMPIIQLTRYVY